MNKENADSERATKKYEEMMTAKLQPVNESLNDVIELTSVNNRN